MLKTSILSWFHCSGLSAAANPESYQEIRSLSNTSLHYRRIRRPACDPSPRAEKYAPGLYVTPPRLYNGRTTGGLGLADAAQAGKVIAMWQNGGMVFERFGSSRHLRIRTADDLQKALELDEAHWVATSAPVDMFNCDEHFLKLLDSDNNGRILCHELKDAIRFALAVLGDREPINARSTSLAPQAVSADTPQGRQVLEAIEAVNTRLGRPRDADITLQQIRHLKAASESRPVSEAGVALPEAADGQVRQFICDIIETIGGVEHPSGGRGVDSATLDTFLAKAHAYLDWSEKGKIPPGKRKTDVMPLGAETTAAYEVFCALRGKLDQYFAQCLALNLDQRFAQRMGWTQEELERLDFDDPAVIEQVLEKAPLAPARADQVLDFGDKINPFYEELLRQFRRHVVEPVLGKNIDSLSAGHWRQIRAFFAAHDRWVCEKPAPEMERLGIEKLQAYVEGDFAPRLRALIAASQDTAGILEKIRLLENVVLLQVHLIDFANNFISFPHLYDLARRAMFEMGTLVMDGRRFNLAVRVRDRNRHKAAAAGCNIFVLYIEVTARADGDTMELAVPVTAGGRGNLCVGKRGVFYDLAGREYDAKVIDIVENPISLQEALFMPFRRLGRVLVGKIESITTAAEKKLDSRVSATVEQVAAPRPATAEAAGASRLSRAGMLMGAGVTLAALGSAVAYITKTLSAVKPLSAILAVLAAAAAVMLPVSIVAFLKLRRRDLSAILEGCGWAINARMRLSRKQCRFFTHRPRYPTGR